MENKKPIYNLIILDESGSMAPIASYILKAYNELAQTIIGLERQLPEQPQLVSCYTFNGLRTQEVLFCQPAGQLSQLNAQNYRPDASTPLLDCMGHAILKLRYHLQQKHPEGAAVLVSILTDGEENASREFHGEQIKALVEELSAQGWTFTYMGTDHDVTRSSASMGIHNAMSFKKDASGISEAFESFGQGMAFYCMDISDRGHFDGKFFEEKEEKEDKK